MNQNFALLRASVPTVSQIQSYIQSDSFFRIKPGANTRVGLTDVVFPKSTNWNFNEWRKSLLDIKLQTDPWPHLISENFLPPGVYSQLIRGLPRGPKPLSSPSRTWVTSTPEFFKDGESKKFFFNSEEEKHWWGTETLITLSELTCAFIDRTTFINLWRLFKPVVPKEIALRDDETLLVQVRITHDRDDYDLDVHLDLPEKFLSILVYLPLDTTSTAGGTSIYKPKPEYLSELTTTEYKGYKYFPTSMFNLEKKIPFAPNIGFVFLRTDESWHGKPINPMEFREDRFTLQINYFRKHKNI